jgi:hypothetical protein
MMDFCTTFSSLLYSYGGSGLLSRDSDWLRAGRSGDQIPVLARFSAPVRSGPGAHRPSYKMGDAPLSLG